MVFSLASGNIAGAFDIVTTNDSIGEVFVARPLDREQLDRYILKVGTAPLPGISVDHPEERSAQPGGQLPRVASPQRTQSRQLHRCP